MSSRFTIWSVAAVALLCPALVQAQWSAVGTGIEYQKYTISGPNNVFVTRLLLSETNAFFESSYGQGRLSGGTEIVSSQASRYDDAIGYWTQSWGTRNDVVVAINGSYFETDGIPFSGQIHSGWYDKRYDNVSGQSGFGFTTNRMAFIGECVSHTASRQFVTYANLSTQNFQGINVAPGDGQLTIFTPQYDTNTLTDNTGSEVLVELTTPFLIKPQPNKVTGTVKQIRQNAGSTQIPFDCIVLSAKGSAATTMLANVAVGDTIGVSQEIASYDSSCATARSLDWTKTYASVSGNWVFLKDGVIQYGIDETGEVHPRTAIALNATYGFFVVCDGRDPGVSVGMTIDQLAEFCKNTLGATWGVNQDGGGSSTMVVNGTVMNNPSDGSQRAVANGMLMCNLVTKSQSTTFTAGQVVTTSGSASVRLGPGTNYASIATVASGTQGTIIDHSLKGVAAKGYNWWKVSFPTATGWVAESLLGGGCTSPTITQHPSNQTVAPGGTATFTVAASGTTPLSYQWQKNSVNISDGGHYSGTTTATLIVSNCDASDAGSYRCVVTNACGSATSNAATLTVQSQTITYIVESRNGGQNYANYSESGKWSNSTAKSTAAGCTTGIGSRYCTIGTTARTAIFKFTPTSGGTYNVYTTNCATTNSGNPAIHRVTHAGGTAGVSVCQNSTCNPNPCNQWYLLGTYTLNAGVQYSVTIDGSTGGGSGPSGNAARADAIKWESAVVDPQPPTITQQPQNQTVSPGGIATFTIAATGDAPLYYQWLKNGVDIVDGGHYSGATTTSLTVSNCDATDEGTYTCDVWNAYGTATSNGATLTINTQPVVFIVESRSGGQNYARYSETGAWSNSTAKSTASGCTSGIGSRYCSIGTTAKTAVFSFTPTAGGTYNVYTTNCLTTNSGNPLIHKITHAGGTATVGVCQNSTCGTNACNKWLLLGTYTLNGGATYTVTLDGSTGAGSLPSGNAGRSDAIKWESQ